MSGGPPSCLIPQGLGGPHRNCDPDFPPTGYLRPRPSHASPTRGDHTQMPCCPGPHQQLPAASPNASAPQQPTLPHAHLPAPPPARGRFFVRHPSPTQPAIGSSCRVGSSAGAWGVAIAKAQFASRFTHHLWADLRGWATRRVFFSHASELV